MKKLLTGHLVLLLALPSSTNFRLESYGFGPGEGGMTSENYNLEAILGEVSGDQDSENFSARSGLIFLQEANAPSISITNGSNYYNKLLVTLNAQNNPTDTVFAIAISDDNWVTTRYIQNDNTIGATLGNEDYQTYAAWGSGSGEFVIGLTPNTTYQVKAKARQGLYTESPWGSESSVATSQVSLTFDIDVASTNTETGAPYSLAMGNLTLGSVTTASDKIWIDMATNAEDGGYVYIYDTNAGLKSTALNYTISAASTDLAGASEGFGLRGDSASGLAFVSPYNGASDNVGIVNTTIREILNSSGAPVASGRASILVKAKTRTTTPAANDYSDIITLITAATF